MDDEASVDAVGVFGPLRRPDGSSDATIGLADPHAFPDLRYYQSLGMELTEPETHPTSGGFWETLSWERADTHPADLILADARGGTVAQILDFLPPSAAALPAVQAGQLVSWETVHAYGFGNVADIISALADEVGAASSDIV